MRLHGGHKMSACENRPNSRIGRTPVSFVTTRINKAERYHTSHQCPASTRLRSLQACCLRLISNNTKTHSAFRSISNGVTCVFPGLAPITDEARRVCIKDQSNPALYCTYTLQWNRITFYSVKHTISGPSDQSMDIFGHWIGFAMGNGPLLLCLEFRAAYILAWPRLQGTVVEA